MLQLDPIMTAFVFTTILVVIHILSKPVSSIIEKTHVDLISLYSGMFLCFIMVILLPEMIKTQEDLGTLVYLFFMLGFAIFYIGEKYLHQHLPQKRNLKEGLSSLYYVGFLIDNIVIGLASFVIFTINPELGIIAAIPLVLHIINASFSIEQLHVLSNKDFALKVLLNISPLIGTALGFYLQNYLFLYEASFAFVVGILFNIVIKDMLPDGKKGSIKLFILGLVINLAVIKIIEFFFGTIH